MTGPARPEREQRLVFGEVAETYDRRRPSYPSRTVDAVLEFAGLTRDTTTPVAEVGAGTGKASVLFASRGIALTAIEPSPAMAEVARENLAPFPNAEVQETTFEDWDPPAHGFGLVFAAQSWHWVSPAGRYEKAHLALRPNGTLALLWNIMVKRGDHRLARKLRSAYGDLLQASPRLAQIESAQSHNWVISEIEATGLYCPVTIERERWTRSYDTESWLGLMSTQSDHRMLDEDTRTALFERIRRTIDSQGGHLEADYVTVAFLARALEPSVKL